MKEQLVSHEVAVLAKEKGFDEPCIKHYSSNPDKDGNYRLHGAKHRLTHKSLRSGGYLAPTQSLLEKWLWDDYGIWIEICLWGDSMWFTCLIKQAKGKDDDGSTIVKQIGLVDISVPVRNPFELKERGLKEALKLIL